MICETYQNFTLFFLSNDTCLLISHKNTQTLELVCNVQLSLRDDWFKANRLT